MKLRNKKTGEIQHAYPVIRICDGKTDICFTSLADLNEAWEDYKPAEPLIKDEKIRKAVRAFSDAVQEKNYILVIKQRSLGIVEFSNGNRFWMRLSVSNETMDALKDRTYYTLAELCGEEE